MSTYESFNRHPSNENLVPKSAYKRRELQLQKARMSSPSTEGIVIERKKSYGIGGAGNIRRPSDVIYPVRRRSSAGESSEPGTSPRDRRGSILNLFRKRRVVETAPSESAGHGRVEFKDVDLGGQRHGAEE